MAATTFATDPARERPSSAQRPRRSDRRRATTTLLTTGALLMVGSCGSVPNPVNPVHPQSPTSSVSASARSGPATPDPPAGSPSSYLPNPEPELRAPERASGSVVTLTGTIDKGEQQGCRMLRVDAVTAYVLISADARLTMGARVTVEGRRAPGLATTCQHGTPFVVDKVVATG